MTFFWVATIILFLFVVSMFFDEEIIRYTKPKSVDLYYRRWRFFLLLISGIWGISIFYSIAIWLL